jgi:signal transduction histidine kinase
MKALQPDFRDAQTLQQLGLASVQIVHDLKNQLNGLKLYATFLRKRMEKNEAAPDEQETIGKLIAGLERAAADMTTLVRYGRAIELRRLPQVDLSKILAEIAAQSDSNELVYQAPAANEFVGEFDIAALTEALKTITSGARQRISETNKPIKLQLTRSVADTAEKPMALIEWRGVQLNGTYDPFRSFNGSDGLRLALAAKLIEAHDGAIWQEADKFYVHLPINV